MTRSIHRAVLLAAAFVLALSSSTASADKEKSRDFYKRGMANYVLEKWDLSIVDFEAGFQEEPEPAFLYNIAQAHKKAGRPREAVSYFRKYLELAPEAKDRGEVEQTVAQLNREIESAPPPIKEVVPEPAKPVAAVPGEAISGEPPAPEVKKRRAWPIVVGVAAGVVLLAGAGVGIYFATRPAEPELAAWTNR